MKAWDTAGASLKGRSAPRCIRVCFSILSNCATIIADGIIVGRKIGTDGLTAISLCVPVYLILCVLGSLFVSGAFTAAPNEIGRAVQTGNDAGRAV